MNKPIAEICFKDENEIYRAEKFVEEVCDYYHVGNEYFANVMLGTTEAIRVVLQKRKDTGAYLTVKAVKDDKGLQFIINGGAGENQEPGSTDPLDQALAEAKLSRELFIIRSLSDETRISAGGQVISLGFNITSLDAERSVYRVGQLKEYLERRKVKINKDNA